MTSDVLDKIAVIDTHVHVWRLSDPWVQWLASRPANWAPVRRDVSFADLRGELDTNSVAELILVQAGMTPDETHELLQLAAGEPTVRGVVGWASLRTAAATARDLDSFTGPGADMLVGIRNNHGWAPDGDALARADIGDSLSVLTERGLTLDLHFADDTGLPLALQVTDAAPDLTVIIDHLGKPRLTEPAAIEPWSRLMTELSQRPGVFVKYSGWATFAGRVHADDVRPYVEHVLDRFGPDRVMYGGNWPVSMAAGTYEETLAATVTALGDRSWDDLAAIFRTTALRCYLPARPPAPQPPLQPLHEGRA